MNHAILGAKNCKKKKKKSFFTNAIRLVVRTHLLVLVVCDQESYEKCVFNNQYEHVCSKTLKSNQIIYYIYSDIFTTD